MACETDPCPVFGFLDHLHSDNGEPFIAKGIQQCAASQVVDGTFVLSAIHRYAELLSIEEPSQKWTEKVSDSILLLFSGPYILVRQFGHEIWHSPERNCVLSAAFWVMIWTKEVGVTIKNCERLILLAN